MATQALAVNGVKVYICGRTAEKLEKVAETYGKGIEEEIIPITADISKEDDIKKLVEEISSKEKSLNSQETSASSASGLSRNLFDDPEETFGMWTDTYRTNVAQLFFMTTAFLPPLQKATEHQNGYPRTVINISSISGIVKTSQHHYAYNASKAAAIHLTKMLANVVTENGLKIRMNNIAPGVFPSKMTASDSSENQKSHVEKGKYEDMANAVLFATTNQYLNGQTVAVDGGYTLHAGSA